MEVREWLKTCSLKLLARELHIDRNSLRKGRDGKAVARSTQKKLLRLFRITKRGVNLPQALSAMRLAEMLHRAGDGRKSRHRIEKEMNAHTRQVAKGGVVENLG